MICYVCSSSNRCQLAIKLNDGGLSSRYAVWCPDCGTYGPEAASAQAALSLYRVEASKPGHAEPNPKLGFDFPP